jgi:hypothetical protein
LSFYEGVKVRVGDLKIKESEVLCTDSTALTSRIFNEIRSVQLQGKNGLQIPGRCRLIKNTAPATAAALWKTLKIHSKASPQGILVTNWP